VDETRDMVTPNQLWLKMKSLSHDDDNDFDVQGRITPLQAVLQKDFEWNVLQSIMNIKFHDSDSLELKMKIWYTVLC